MKNRKSGGACPPISKTRDIGAGAIPRAGESTKVISEAKKGTTGIIPAGGNAMPRLDRPARRHGGAAKKDC